MTVNNVNALSPFGAVQGGQTSVKPEEFVQERFDKLMTKMGDQLAGMQQSQTGSVTAVAPKQAVVENAQETAQLKDTVTQKTAEPKKPEDTVKDDGNGTVEQDKSESTAKTQETAQQDTEKQEAVEKAAEELVAEIANVMDIPLEKVEEAMENLYFFICRFKSFNFFCIY